MAVRRGTYLLGRLGVFRKGLGHVTLFHHFCTWVGVEEDVGIDIDTNTDLRCLCARATICEDFETQTG
jgi:hypothetical protein